MSEAQIDIRPDHWAIVRDILQRHVPKHAVWAFGSRAKWTAKEYSDLDLAIITESPLPLATSAALAEDFSESDLPWKVDIVDWAETSEKFRQIIERDRVVVQELTLGSIVRLVRGTTYKSSLLGQSGPVLLGLASIQRNGGFRKDALKTYGGDSPAKLLLSPGDLFVSLKDVTQSADLLGAVARVPESIDSGRLTQDTVKLDLGSSNYPRDLLYWTLRTPQYRAYCRNHATGTTNLGLSREDFLAYPLPGRTDEVLRLVEALEALDKKIELNRRMNETLEAMARSLFKSWFVDFDGVPIEDMQESELGLIPRDWQIGTLANLAVLNPETWTRQTRPDEIRYVDLSNTKWGRIESITSYIAEEAPSRAQRVLRPDDTIVGTVRPGNGSYTLISEEGLTGSTGFAVLRPKQKEYTALVYLAATASENIESLASLADGGAYPAVRADVVANTPVVIADQETITAFAQRVSPLLEKFAENERQSQALAQLRDTLLPKLISGEVRIKDAERLAETA